MNGINNTPIKSTKPTSKAPPNGLNGILQGLTSVVAPAALASPAIREETPTHAFKPKHRIYRMWPSKCSYCKEALDYEKQEVEDDSKWRFDDILKRYICSFPGCHRLRCEECLVDAYDIPCGTDAPETEDEERIQFNKERKDRTTKENVQYFFLSDVLYTIREEEHREVREEYDEALSAARTSEEANEAHRQYERESRERKYQRTAAPCEDSEEDELHWIEKNAGRVEGWYFD
ncbi:hypothetical protein BJ508DRAFT_329334 [Ascobolus immersus RN42]|uniref:Uncharacterized protein n=1 Tax=Ascobolus immersus RN42 TaxID=1160509 RepID=A0A3N4I9C0_ASCIM|nr:hypothetical protein BJ508DRAFT_329334 [Ascobolus immersus RN42]